MDKKKIRIIVIAVAVVIALSIFIVPPNYNKPEMTWLSTDTAYSEKGLYDRRKACEHAKYATENTEDGVFRYLDTSKGDSATNCANFVSQCLLAGGWTMNDDWYMKEYSWSTLYPRRFADKLGSFFRARFFEISPVLVDEAGLFSTDMKYVWTNTWTCAGLQYDYGMSRFYSNSYEINDFGSLSRIAEENAILPGDIIYQGKAAKHHVVIITDIDDQGVLYYSSNNPVKYNEKLDENGWNKGGFSGGSVVVKVRDNIN